MKLTEGKYIRGFLIKATIILVEFSKAISDCSVVDLESGILKLGFPGALKVLEYGKRAVQSWMFVSRKRVKNAIGILTDV